MYRSINFNDILLLLIVHGVIIPRDIANEQPSRAITRAAHSPSVHHETIENKISSIHGIKASSTLSCLASDNTSPPSLRVYQTTAEGWNTQNHTFNIPYSSFDYTLAKYWLLFFQFSGVLSLLINEKIKVTAYFSWACHNKCIVWNAFHFYNKKGLRIHVRLLKM